MTEDELAGQLKLNEAGLIPVVVQEYTTRDVLMLAWMDVHAAYLSITTGQATYWSRSRREYWVKGESSGHSQKVRELAVDCDGDTILLTVEQTGAACHTNTRTCFSGREIFGDIR